MRYAFAILLAVAAAAPAAAETFNGVRVGVQVGVQSDKTDTAALLSGSGLGALSVNRKSAAGAVVTATLGYDTSVFTDFVVGFEGSASYTSGRNRQTLTLAAAPTSPIAVTYTSNFAYDFTARAGVKVTPATLVYVRGGYAGRSLSSAVGTTGLPAVLAGGRSDGWTAGAGIEQAFGPHLSARVEYRYFNYKGPSSRQQLVAGVGYTF